MNFTRILLGFGLLASAALAGSRFVGLGETRPMLAWQQASNQPPLLPYIPTYYKDVKPILERACTDCHLDKGIAPFALTDAASASEHARAVQFAVQARRMPPWQPGGASPKFQNELKLSDEEIAIIANWAWAGAPTGKASDAKPSVTKASARTPDQSIDMGRDFLPDASLSDEYRCFVIDPKLNEERFLAAYGIQPGNQSLVHHVILFQVSGSYINEVRVLEANAAKQDGDRGGYTCFGGVGVGNSLGSRLSSGSGGTTTNTTAGTSNAQGSTGFVGSWTPGSGVVNYPKGTGVRLQPGSVLVAQLHYNINAKNAGQRDRTFAKLYFAPKETHSNLKALRLSALVGPVEIPCAGAYPNDPQHPCHRDAAYERVRAYQEPALTGALEKGALLTFCNTTVSRIVGQSPTGVSQSTCDFPVSSNRVVVGVQGHMHLLGKHIKIEANPGTPKARVLLEIPAYDFHWQSGFWLVEPIALSAGDKLRITCGFDNRAQNQAWIAGKQQTPRYVVWGEGTNDEMCLAGLQFVNP